VYALLGSRPAKVTSPSVIQERLSLAMLNEAMRCLDEGVIRGPRDGDVGAIFGIGFPPFRGGPFRAIDAMGPADVARRLEVLNAAHPGRFEPAAHLVRIAARGGKVYDGK
jgi:3-hydroxyacyl-CoA dehydrogenase/enoyl-CoA hydratase/3-hydroxybutyryl-CoA epimerase